MAPGALRVMRVGFRLLLPPLGGALFTFLAIAAPAAPAAERITMRLEVFGPAGLRVLTGRTTIDENGKQYAITGDIATRGIAGWFAYMKSHSQVLGRLTAATAQPD